MQLNHALQLAYCTNIHRGESWPETFATLKDYTLAVREQVCPQAPFAIGLRLGEAAARQLSEPSVLLDFQRWLDRHGCYVFTINGFPYGRFHGSRVKEAVYRPDWTTRDRLDYTNLLFDLLAALLPPGLAGSVSTLPGSFKGFAPDATALAAIRENLWRCVQHVARLSSKTGHDLHLGLEPEPLCLLENCADTLQFFDQLRAEHPGDDTLVRHLGLNYDTCHFAVEFEEPQTALAAFVDAGIRISKLHLSSALKVPATAEACRKLQKFADDIYLHQVISRDAAGRLARYTDLPDALADAASATNDTEPTPEWRIHFHVPLHAAAMSPFQNTTDHLIGALDWLARNPQLCSHLEMETYTWEVLPPELKAQSVVDQLAAEYAWTLARLRERGLAE
jgi:hypothetical protein